MRNTKNANKAVYLTLLLLVAAVVVLVLINSGDAELRRALEENREFRVLIDGEPAATIGLGALLGVEPQEFAATLASSVGLPREVTLKGVELRQLLETLDIDAAQASMIVVSGMDGYVSPLTNAEVNKAENVYICYSMDGAVLKTQSEGGYGPFLMVIRSERFAQRWCKYVDTVDVRR